MKPEIWGPHAWMFLHSVTLEYPENPTSEDKQNMILFINSLGNVLPCHKCRNNFKIHLEKYPLNENVLLTKKNLVKWLIDIHNCVNGIKKCKELSYDEALEALLNNYDTNKNTSMIWIYIFILILFIIIIATLFLSY